DLPLDGASVTQRWNQPTGTASLSNDPAWTSFRPWAERHGLRACLCWPAFDRCGSLVALVTMYFRKSRQPTWFESYMAEKAAYLAGVVVMHERAFARVRLSEKRF